MHNHHPFGILRITADCLRISCSRQIIIVYPDGNVVIYSQTKPEVIEQIIPENLIGVVVVQK
jgi:(2Fe-2S) ferredoxin